MTPSTREAEFDSLELLSGTWCIYKHWLIGHWVTLLWMFRCWLRTEQPEPQNREGDCPIHVCVRIFINLSYQISRNWYMDRELWICGQSAAVSVGTDRVETSISWGFWRWQRYLVTINTSSCRKWSYVHGLLNRIVLVMYKECSISGKNRHPPEFPECPFFFILYN